MSDIDSAGATDSWRRFQAQHIEAQTIAAQEAAKWARASAGHIEVIKNIAIGIVVLMALGFFVSLTTLVG